MRPERGGERHESVQDLEDHLQDSGFFPKNNKDSQKCQAGDPGDQLMASDLNLKGPPFGKKAYPQDFWPRTASETMPAVSGVSFPSTYPLSQLITS